jgi:hypothetical protein
MVVNATITKLYDSLKRGHIEPEIDWCELINKDSLLMDRDICVPDFFICGAARSGTTLLYQYLSSSDVVYTPNVKEPGYFSALRPMEDPLKYAGLFSGASDKKLIGEASTAYLSSPDSAERISRVCPEAKILILLRNPMDRAVSLYRWMTSSGNEWMCSFESALEFELNRIDDRDFIINCPEYYYNYLYYTTGLYSVQVQRFKDYFPEDNIMVILFSRFIDSPDDVAREALEFIGGKAFDTVSVTDKNKNESHRVLCPYAQYVAMTLVRQDLFPTAMAAPLLSLNRLMGERLLHDPVVGEVLNETLRQWYISDWNELEDMIGETLVPVWGS